MEDLTKNLSSYRTEAVVAEAASVSAKARYKEALKAWLSQIPDNPNIKRLGGNSFTIKLSDLGNNWSPAFHDNKTQVRALLQLVESKFTAKAMDDMLWDIVNTGKYNGTPKMSFNDSVRSSLKQILEKGQIDPLQD